MTTHSLRHLTKKERDSLKSFADRVRALFPKQVRNIILFGSKARGDDRPESDLDLVVTVKRFSPGLRNRIYELAVDVEGEHDYLIQLSAHVWEEAHLKRLIEHERRIGLDIQNEGISL